MSNKIQALVAGAAVLSFAATGVIADAAKTVSLVPAKGVSFDLGSKHAMTLFTTENGACHLTVVIAEQPDMDGMAGHTASRVKVTVQPGTPARVETAEGKALVFICEPGANSMKVELPPDFKFSPKG